MDRCFLCALVDRWRDRWLNTSLLVCPATTVQWVAIQDINNIILVEKCMVTNNSNIKYEYRPALTSSSCFTL